MGILVKESIFIEETMQDTSIDFLLFDNLRFLEHLKSDNKLLDSLIDLMRFSRENVLEILICCFVNLLSALCRSHLSWEQDRILCDYVFDLILGIL